MELRRWVMGERQVLIRVEVGAQSLVGLTSSSPQDVTYCKRDVLFKFRSRPL